MLFLIILKKERMSCPNYFPGWEETSKISEERRNATHDIASNRLDGAADWWFIGSDPVKRW
jgi:hypothetical protein